MSNFLPPKIGCNLSSAKISRLFFGFWRSCFLMCAQIFFVTSLRGSGSVPTILAKCSEGCIGFIKALFFALGVVFAIFAPILVASVPNSVIAGIVADQLQMCVEATFLVLQPWLQRCLDRIE